MNLRRAVIIIVFIITVACILTIIKPERTSWASVKHKQSWTKLSYSQKILMPPILHSSQSTFKEQSSQEVTAPDTVMTTTTSMVSTTIPPTTTTTFGDPPLQNSISQPSGNDGIWGCIIRHESGGDPTAVNSYSGAGGLYQFLPSSWVSYGGEKYAAAAQYATVEQQNEIAYYAQSVSGWWPWSGSGCTPIG